MFGSKAARSALSRTLQRSTATRVATAATTSSLRRLPCGATVAYVAHHSAHTNRRSQSTTAGEATNSSSSGGNSDTSAEPEAAPSSTFAAPRQQSEAGKLVMERAADARREIFQLWSRTAAAEEAAAQATASLQPDTAAAEAKAAEERCAAVAALLAKYAIDPTAPREEDVSRGLGDALDRLLLLCVPLASSNGTDTLVKLMQVSARQGRQLSMRTIQHLFARTSSYAEALAVFYAMRRSNFAMSMEAYHAMLYSLQRLEEEGWAAHFHEELVASKGEAVSEQALDFVLRGVDNQLMPENKPWLGRVMFAEAKDNAATRRQSMADFDAMGQLWVQRYKNGGTAPE